MEQVIDFFIEWGYVGIFLSAFLAGSVLPFSSELVLVALVGTYIPVRRAARALPVEALRDE